jgi:hypothetical protein
VVLAEPVNSAGSKCRYYDDASTNHSPVRLSMPDGHNGEVNWCRR